MLDIQFRLLYNNCCKVEIKLKLIWQNKPSKKIKIILDK